MERLLPRFLSKDLDRDFFSGDLDFLPRDLIVLSRERDLSRDFDFLSRDLDLLPRDLDLLPRDLDLRSRDLDLLSRDLDWRSRPLGFLSIDLDFLSTTLVLLSVDFDLLLEWEDDLLIRMGDRLRERDAPRRLDSVLAPRLLDLLLIASLFLEVSECLRDLSSEWSRLLCLLSFFKALLSFSSEDFFLSLTLAASESLPSFLQSSGFGSLSLGDFFAGEESFFDEVESFLTGEGSFFFTGEDSLLSGDFFLMEESLDSLWLRESSFSKTFSASAEESDKESSFSAVEFFSLPFDLTSWEKDRFFASSCALAFWSEADSVESWFSSSCSSIGS